MQVYSHSSHDKNGQSIGSKYLIHHLKSVKEVASENFYGKINFERTDKLINVLKKVCLLHDFGKYTRYFQDYLLQNKQTDSRLKRHSSLGATIAYILFRNNDIEAGLLAFFLIRLHHGNLINFDKALWPDHYNGHEEAEMFEKQTQSLLNFNDLKRELPEIDETKFQFVEARELYSKYKKIIRKNPSIERYFIINYLFSLLTEADKLDASSAARYIPQQINENSVSQRKGFGDPFIPKGDIIKFSQNELRNYVRARVVEKINREDILDKRIFTLTAPTGIGKTMSSLDFVLRLRAKIHNNEGFLPQIIYGLPFINIIEQAYEEYTKTLQQCRILAHYQYADIFGNENETHISWNDEEKGYQQKKMEWDTWQGDVVITTFVQFFETLIGNRNKLLKKFHHYAGSIIILDEIQTLSLEKIPVISAALYSLSKYLNARILIMTATQPKLFKVMEEVLGLKIDEEALKPIPLLENADEVFRCFNRTTIFPLLDKQTDNESFLELFSNNWEDNKNWLIVLNKVNRSIEIFEKLKALYSDKKNIKLFYLSTNITPIQRHQTINRLKNSLPEKNCILVSTQVVEAGVDLDFDAGYRDLGPVDSIIQVAGRINRENSFDRQGAPLFVVNFGDCKTIYGTATAIQSEKALSGTVKIPEKDYKRIVEEYFNEVTKEELCDFSLSKEIFNAMKSLKYAHPGSSGNNTKDKTIEDFSIIEEKKYGISVFVEAPEDEKGRIAREKFKTLIRGEISKEEFETNYKLDFHQRIISVPKYFSKAIELMNEERITENILWIKPEEYPYYYNNETGFNRTDEHADKIIMF